MADFMTFAAGGGDFDSTTKVVETQNGDWEEYDVTALVNQYLSGERENLGFLLNPGAGMGLFSSGINYHSSDALSSADRPRLVLDLGASPTVKSPVVKGVTAVDLSITHDALRLVVSEAGMYNVTISDTRGRVVYQGAVHSESELIMPTATYSSGIYFLSVVGNGVSQSERFVIK